LHEEKEEDEIHRAELRITQLVASKTRNPRILFENFALRGDGDVAASEGGILTY
jgi:hypothetical protein